MNDMTIPQCRERLNEIAEMLPTMTFAKAQEEIRKVIEQMHRRPAVRRAQTRSVKMTPELRRHIANMASARPDLSYQAIGQLYGVSAGRVSEAVAGFRRSTPEKPVEKPTEGYLPVIRQQPYAPPPPSPFYADRIAL